MRISRIFLYGLVRHRQPAFEELLLGEGLKFLSSASVPGMIFDLGDYPGFVEGDGEVKGDLFEITNPRILERLDAFEDYDPNRPGRSLYIRRPITIRAPHARAWIYKYNRDIADCPRVESGDWLAWKGR